MAQQRGGPPSHWSDRSVPRPWNGYERRDNNYSAGDTRSTRADFAGPAIQRRPSRDMFQPTHPPRGPVDPNHGRLNQDFSHAPRTQTQDPNYGRLNAPQENIPSGPRGKPGMGRGGRPFSTPATPAPNPMPAAADQPATGPAADRREQGWGAAVPPPPNMHPQAGLPGFLGMHPGRVGEFHRDPPAPSGPADAPAGPRDAARPLLGVGGGAPARGPRDGPAQMPERSVFERNLGRGRGVRPSQSAENLTTFNPFQQGGHARPEGPIRDAPHPRPLGRFDGPLEPERESRNFRDRGQNDRGGRRRSRSPGRARRTNDEANAFGVERDAGTWPRGNDQRDRRDVRHERDPARENRDRRDRPARDEGRAMVRDEPPRNAWSSEARAGMHHVRDDGRGGHHRRDDGRGGSHLGRDERDRRGRDDGQDDGRDARKRGRPDDGGNRGDFKRPRRSFN